MLGRAVATIVWSRAAMKMPTISPPITIMIWRWLNEVGPSAGSAPGSPLDTSVNLLRTLRLRRRMDHHDRPDRVAQHALRHQRVDHAAEEALVVGAHDDDVDVEVLGGGHD